jgi:hypothetical protein
MATKRVPSISNGGKRNACHRSTGTVDRVGSARLVAQGDRQAGGDIVNHGGAKDSKRAVPTGARRSRLGDDRSAGSGNSRGLDRARAQAANGDDGNHLFVPARRTRLSNSLDKKTLGWLRRVIRVHARLCEIVSRFGQKPLKRCDEMGQRIAAGDRTLLHDCVSVAIYELQSVLDAIEASMRGAPATDALPGSAAKIEVLRQRFAGSQFLWVDGDRACDAASDETEKG